MEISVESNIKYLAVSNAGTVVVNLQGEFSIEEFEAVIDNYKSKLDRYKTRLKGQLIQEIENLQSAIDYEEVKLKNQKEKVKELYQQLNKL